jgi:peptidoglycan/xylan/chitin deacetylase (PgdA/CDA1 family)
MSGARSVLGRVLKPIIRRHSSFVGSVVAVKTNAAHVVLTYDDGPEPGGTDCVLTALADRQATATFFVLLTRARAHPGLLGEVMAEGHEIALHGQDHRRLTQYGFEEVRRRTQSAKSELEDMTGRSVTWMRPPYGRQTFTSWRAVTATGLQPVMWGPTTWDSRHISQAERVRKAVEGTVQGSILLAHDGHAGPADGVDDGPAPNVDRGDLTRRVLDGYSDLGLHGRSLSDSLESGSAIRAAWFKR